MWRCEYSLTSTSRRPSVAITRAWVYMSVHGYTWVYTSVHECARVYTSAWVYIEECDIAYTAPSVSDHLLSRCEDLCIQSVISHQVDLAVCIEIYINIFDAFITDKVPCCTFTFQRNLFWVSRVLKRSIIAVKCKTVSAALLIGLCQSTLLVSDKMSVKRPQFGENLSSGNNSVMHCSMLLKCGRLLHYAL